MIERVIKYRVLLITISPVFPISVQPKGYVWYFRGAQSPWRWQRPSGAFDSFKRLKDIKPFIGFVCRHPTEFIEFDGRLTEREKKGLT